MTEPRINNTKSDKEIKLKQTLNAAYCRAWRKKNFPGLPKNQFGQRYNPKFKWVGLALELDVGEFWDFDTWNQAVAFARAIKRIGYISHVNQIDGGFRTTKGGLRNG